MFIMIHSVYSEDISGTNGHRVVTHVSRTANGNSLCFLSPAQPEVYMFAKNSQVETNIILSCLATGFYAKDTVLQIKRNGRILTREDGIMTSGVRPNDDDTYQQKQSVEILKSDPYTFTCEVIHQASNLRVQREWGKKLFHIVLPFVTMFFLFFFPFL